jgi:hypothetical protein
MNTSHTPAPWVSHLTGYTGRASAKYVINDKKGRAVAHIKHSTISPMEANARLIAAAPELLEALNAIVKRAEDPALCDDTDTLLRNARTAIAKATGEQPCTTN